MCTVLVITTCKLGFKVQNIFTNYMYMYSYSIITCVIVLFVFSVGVYKLVPSSCHHFEAPFYTYDM